VRHEGSKERKKDYIRTDMEKNLPSLGSNPHLLLSGQIPKPVRPEGPSLTLRLASSCIISNANKTSERILTSKDLLRIKSLLRFLLD
jgi:hypothetical protein